jgi:hypothetical protein
MKVPQVTIYAKSAGVEIGPYEKRSEGRPPEGRIALRFFRMESGAAAIRFVAEPAEGFELYRKIHKVFRDGGRRREPPVRRERGGRHPADSIASSGAARWASPFRCSGGGGDQRPGERRALPARR